MAAIRTGDSFLFNEKPEPGITRPKLNLFILV